MQQFKGLRIFGWFKMMRRPQQNYPYEPVPQNNQDELELENERAAEELKNKISNLKSLTIDIGELIAVNCDLWPAGANSQRF